MSRRFTHHNCASATRGLRANCQAFFPIKPSKTLEIDLPSLASEQDVNSALPIGNANRGDRLDANLQRNVHVSTHRSIPHGATIDAEYLARTPFA